jgi:rhamnogalacturonan hydrolase
MFKSYGGSGSVYDITLQNFIGHENAYSLYINGYWTSQTEVPGNGVLYHDITFNNWKGTCSDGARRGPIRIICPNGAPCYNIVLENIDIWTEMSSVEYYNCESAYGTGACLKGGTSLQRLCSRYRDNLISSVSGFHVIFDAVG